MRRAVYPPAGVQAASLGAQTWTTFSIFFISGLGLKRGATAAALTDWKSALYGFVSILLLTPLLAPAAYRLPLQPPELALGLAVFCCMPTTLSTGIALTQVSWLDPA